MKKALVIVESPAKARTISRFLGPGYQVEASMGHIRDLPSTASEIPSGVKDQPWARLAVDVDHGFKPVYIVPDQKKAQVKKLKALAKDAQELYLATDEDREGEAIAWHLLEVLEPKVPVKRMVFHEITKTAIEEALSHTRDIDLKLVDAQEARRILDRLYGYEVSPVLWRKVRPRLSAGRVQSVAVRLIVSREKARMRFVKATYWDLDAQLQARTEQKEKFPARLVELAGKRVATGKDFDPNTGALTDREGTILLGEAEAKALAEALDGKPFTVSGVTERPFTQRPYPPFITSTLQQESARKLRFTAQRTMRIAQSLYENGYITYMRTDSTNLSTQAVNAARNLVRELYGAQFLPDEPRSYAKKVKGAQEAHEAIRPAGDVFRTPDQLKGELDDDALRLYDMIWKRTVASQMKDATGVRTTVQLRADAPQGRATFTSTGKVLHFPGFLRAYVEGSDEPEAELEEQERVLPPLKEGQQTDALAIDAKGHTTQPPARYTEASLIKELEERGIGRPSTYASILQTIQDRGYVWKKATALVPTFTAFAVTNLLEKHFGELVDYDFTAKMEEDLDSVAAGEREATPWLKNFYFGNPKAEKQGEFSAIGLKKRIGTGWEEIDPREISSIPVGQDEQGRQFAVRVGRYGPYVQVGDDGARANIPEELPPDELSPDSLKQLIERSEKGDRVLGPHPDTGEAVYIKSGRFGPYVQQGELPPLPEGKKKPAKDAPKPKMASLFKSMTPETITLDEAVMLLSFPREIGVHPKTGEMITAQDGRFGPYLKMGNDTRSLQSQDQLLTVTLDEAVAIFELPKGRRGQPSQRQLADVGPHPKSQAPVRVMNGRFGAYVTDGVINASLPKGKDPGSLTMDEAVELLDAREAKLKEMGKDPRAEKAAKGARRAGGVKAAAKTKRAKAAPDEEGGEAGDEGEAAEAKPAKKATKKAAAGGKRAAK